MTDIKALSQYGRILNIKEVTQITGIARSTLYCIIDEKSRTYDPTFPKRVYLTPSRIGWVSSEIDAWLLQKMQRREQDQHLARRGFHCGRHA